MDIKDFKVGQTVYIRLTGNAKRGKSGADVIEEWEIVCVGRKLIKAKRKGWSDSSAITFEKSERGYKDKFVERTNVCVDYVMYADKKDIENEIEREELLSSISAFFRGYGKKNISLENLRKISELIGKTEIQWVKGEG